VKELTDFVAAFSPILTIVATILIQIIALYKWRFSAPAQNEKTHAGARKDIGQAADDMANAGSMIIDRLMKRNEELENKDAERDGYINAIDDELRIEKNKVLARDDTIARLEKVIETKDDRISILEYENGRLRDRLIKIFPNGNNGSGADPNLRKDGSMK
jgi:hypothetical protein